MTCQVFDFGARGALGRDKGMMDVIYSLAFISRARKILHLYNNVNKLLRKDKTVLISVSFIII